MRADLLFIGAIMLFFLIGTGYQGGNLVNSKITSLPQDRCDICRQALQQDLIQLNLDKAQSLHYLNTINSTVFSELKKNGGLSVTIPIKGVPITPSANWDQFKSWRQSLFMEESFTYNEEYSLNLLQKFTSERGYESFDNCIKRCMEAIPDLYIYIIDSDDKTVTMKVFYQPPRGVNNGIKVKNFTIVGGADYDGILKPGTIINPLQEITIIINRQNNARISGALNAGDYTANFRVEPFIIFKRKDVYAIAFSPNGFSRIEEAIDLYANEGYKSSSFIKPLRVMFIDDFGNYVPGMRLDDNTTKKDAERILNQYFNKTGTHPVGAVYNLTEKASCDTYDEVKQSTEGPFDDPRHPGDREWQYYKCDCK